MAEQRAISPPLEAFSMHDLDSPIGIEDFDTIPAWKQVLNNSSPSSRTASPQHRKKLKSPTPIPPRILERSISYPRTPSPTREPEQAVMAYESAQDIVRHQKAQRSFLNDTVSNILKRRASTPSLLDHHRRNPTKTKLYILFKIALWIVRAKRKTLKKKHRQIYERVIQVAQEEGIITKLTKDDKDTPYWKQGNLDMYSEDNLKKRLELYKHEQIKGCINMWWSATVKIPNKPTHISKATYISLTMAVYIVMMPGDSGKTLEDARRIAEVDWFRDAQGYATMDYKMFYDSIFELADLWCETVEAREYLEFLDKMFEKVYLDETLPKVVLKHVEPNFLKHYATVVAEEEAEKEKKAKKKKRKTEKPKKPLIQVEQTKRPSPVPPLPLVNTSENRSTSPVKVDDNKYVDASTSPKSITPVPPKPNISPRYLSKLKRIQRAQEILRGILAILEQREQYKLEKTIICRLLHSISSGMNVVIPVEIIRLLQSDVIDKCHKANMERLGVVNVEDLILALRSIETNTPDDQVLLDSPRDALKAKLATKLEQEYKVHSSIRPSYVKVLRPQTAPSNNTNASMNIPQHRPSTTKERRKQSLPTNFNPKKLHFYHEDKWNQVIQLGEQVLSSQELNNSKIVTSSLQNPLPKLETRKSISSPSISPILPVPTHSQVIIDKMIDTAVQQKEDPIEENDEHYMDVNPIIETHMRDTDVDSLFSTDSEEQKSVSSFLDDMIDTSEQMKPLYTPEEPRPLSPITSMLLENRMLSEKVSRLKSKRPTTAPSVHTSTSPSAPRIVNSPVEAEVTAAYYKRVRKEEKFNLYVSIEQVHNPFLIPFKKQSIRTSWVPQQPTPPKPMTRPSTSKTPRRTTKQATSMASLPPPTIPLNAKQQLEQQIQILEAKRPHISKKEPILALQEPTHKNSMRSSLTSVSRLTRQMQSILSSYQ